MSASSAALAMRSLDEVSCDDGLGCDPRADGAGYVCGAPLTLQGRVVDALDGDVLEGGRVVVLGAACSNSARSDPRLRRAG